MSEFYGERRLAELGDPFTDPPMTVRVHPDDEPYDPAARRAIRLDVRHRSGAWPWVYVTGGDAGCLIDHEAVESWPVTHPIVYCTAHRHAAHAASTPALELDGSDAEGAAPFKDARPAR